MIRGEERVTFKNIYITRKQSREGEWEKMRRLLQCCKCPEYILKALAPYSYEQAKEVLFQSDLELLDKILKSGIEIPSDQQNLLILALSEGKEEAALFLIREHFHLFQFNRRNDKGDSMLMIAIFRKMHKAIKELIDRSDLNACDFRRNTPFIAAAANGDLQTLKMLIQKPECKVLVRNDDGQSALHRACYFGEIETVEWLLDNTNLKVRERDKRGNNSVHLACEGVNIPLTRYLLKKVVNSERLLIKNNDDKTPLDILLSTIESVAPHFKQALNLDHLRPLEQELLQ